MTLFDTTNLLNKIKTLDLSNLEQVEFWGGETLLYWENVKPLMEFFDKPEMDFVIPTNGTPLQIDHIDFLKNLQGRTTIELSHDGPLHDITRGPNPLDKLIPVFYEVEKYPEQIRFIISVTISNLSYDLIDINKFFSNWFHSHIIKPIPLYFRPVWAYDLNSSQYNLEKVLVNYEKILRKYLDLQIEQFKKNNNKIVNRPMLESQLFHIPIEDDSNYGIVAIASSFKQSYNKTFATVCGQQSKEILTFDFMGNIRACQNVGSETFNGNILDDNYSIKGFSVIKRETCLSCPVFNLCLGGCPLDEVKDNDEYFESNCKANFVHYGVMLEKSLELLFGEKIERVG